MKDDEDKTKEQLIQELAELRQRIGDIQGRLHSGPSSQQAEEALGQSEERYRSMYETAAVSIWDEDFSALKAALDDLKTQGITDMRAYLNDHPEFVAQAAQMVNVRDVNAATLRIFEAKSKADLLGSLDKVFTPESLQNFREEMIAIAEGQTYFEGETINQTLNGERHDVLMTMTIPSEVESYRSVLVSMMDITARKQAEAKLRESEERYRLLVEGAQVGIALYDREDRLILINDQGAHNLGGKSEDFIGRTLSEFLDPPTATFVHQRIQGIFATGEVTHVEDTFELAGHELSFLSVMQPVTDATGAITGVQIISHDITARKQAEQALRESETRFRMLSEAAFEGIGITEKGRLLDANEQLVQMFGYTKSELKDRPVMDMVAPESRALVEEHFRTGDERPYNHMALRKDGTIFPVEIRGRMMPYEGRMVRVTAIEDITERKQQEEELRKSQILYGQAERMGKTGYFEWDHINEKMVSCSEQLALHYGMSVDEALEYFTEPEAIFRVIHPDDRVHYEQHRNDSVEQHKGMDIEYRVINPSGVVRHIHLLTENVLDDQGRLITRFGTEQDITARKQAEQALQESETRVRMLSEAAFEGIGITEKRTLIGC